MLGIQDEVVRLTRHERNGLREGDAEGVEAGEDALRLEAVLAGAGVDGGAAGVGGGVAESTDAPDAHVCVLEAAVDDRVGGGGGRGSGGSCGG